MRADLDWRIHSPCLANCAEDPVSGPSSSVLTHRFASQSLDSRRWRSRNPHLPTPHSACPNSTWQRSLLLPSVCRGARDYPYDVGGKCGAESHQYRHGVEKQTRFGGKHGGYQCEKGERVRQSIDCGRTSSSVSTHHVLLSSCSKCHRQSLCSHTSRSHRVFWSTRYLYSFTPLSTEVVADAAAPL